MPMPLGQKYGVCGGGNFCSSFPNGSITGQCSFHCHCRLKSVAAARLCHTSFPARVMEESGQIVLVHTPKLLYCGECRFWRTVSICASPRPCLVRDWLEWHLVLVAANYAMRQEVLHAWAACQ